jgi:hypothetical protein
MSIEINDALKEKFIEFCNKNYPNKIRKDNCFNNNKFIRTSYKIYYSAEI